MKREYDFAFSLGYCCGVTQALRAAGLQFASYPLDWLGSPSLRRSAEVVADGFRDWLRPEDMRLLDVLHGPGFGTRIYLNERTQLGFSHEFPDTLPLEESLPKVRRTYDRRVARLLSRLAESRRVLAVYLEHPSRPGLPAAELAVARDLLRSRCPGAELDLLYFHEDPSCREPKETFDSDGLVSVAADYRVLENGEVTQYVKLPVLVSVLRRRAVLSGGGENAADARKYADAARACHALRWGPDASWARRWLNQRAYKLFRLLEKRLVRKGLIHREERISFWKEGT